MLFLDFFLLPVAYDDQPLDDEPPYSAGAQETTMAIASFSFAILPSRRRRYPNCSCQLVLWSRSLSLFYVSSTFSDIVNRTGMKLLNKGAF